MTRNQKIDLSANKDKKIKAIKHQKGMPTIRCVCGLRILIIPDLQAMNRAIKKHLLDHKQADNGLTLDSLEEFLTEQILIAASKMNFQYLS